MNNTRRKVINDLISELNDLQGKFADIENQVEELVGQEQYALDGLPESLQDSDRAGAMVDAIENLYGAHGITCCIQNSIMELCDILRDATN